MIDQIGGWTTAEVGQGYGEGYVNQTKHQWLLKINPPLSDLG